MSIFFLINNLYLFSLILFLSKNLNPRVVLIHFFLRLNTCNNGDSSAWAMLRLNFQVFHQVHHFLKCLWELMALRKSIRQGDSCFHVFAFFVSVPFLSSFLVCFDGWFTQNFDLTYVIIYWLGRTRKHIASP